MTVVLDPGVLIPQSFLVIKREIKTRCQVSENGN
jgi:hypothetical protein